MNRWKSIKIEDKPYIFCIDKPLELSNGQNLITFWLSDFRVIYKEHMELDELLDRSKLENTIVEYESHIVLETIFNGEAQKMSLLSDANDASVFRLNCKYFVSKVPFHFYWKLVEQSANVFFEEITKPLLVSMIDAQSQRTQLMDIIQAKDVEIAQYKLDGAELIRKQLATVPFDREAFSMTSRTIEATAFGGLVELESDFLGFSPKSSFPENPSPTARSDEHPSKKRLFPSPPKPTKRMAKEILARSKFQSGPNAMMVYGDEDDDDEDNPKGDSDSSRRKPTNQSQRNHTNGPKVKTKLNL